MNNKNIDKLFKDQLKNLEATPNKRVWNNIESKLKKKKRRVIPFWWFTTGGIAAILILGLLIYPFSTNEENLNKNDSNTTITNVSDQNIKAKSKDSVFKTKNNQEDILLVKEDKNIKTIKNNKQNIKKPNNSKNLVSSKNAMKKILLATNSDVKKEEPKTKETLIVSETKNDTLEHTHLKNQKEKDKLKENTSNKRVDIQNFIKKKDSVGFAKSSKNNWSISPVFAVLNSNSFSKSSPVDKGLSNSTKGKNSISYGVQIGYQINKKWTIQSGVLLQEMNFANEQVTVASSISKNTSAPVAFNTGGSFKFNTNSNPAQSLDVANSLTTSSSDLNGDLNQVYGYIEIPVEVKYSLLNNNKFNTQIVAGFSSLFLSKNKINFNTQFISKSGEATNLNNMNFSGNLGFDFNYNLNKNFSLNLNPMIKAQLNTFSKSSNGFAPFNLGLYTGIKYQF